MIENQIQRYDKDTGSKSNSNDQKASLNNKRIKSIKKSKLHISEF